MLYDSHIHSNFSWDSQSCVKEIFTRAKEIGLSGIAITDHFDFDHPDGYLYNIDFSKRMQEINELSLCQVHVGNFFEK